MSCQKLIAAMEEFAPTYGETLLGYEGAVSSHVMLSGYYWWSHNWMADKLRRSSTAYMSFSEAYDKAVDLVTGERTLFLLFISCHFATCDEHSEPRSDTP